jgi:two-component system response regulator
MITSNILLVEDNEDDETLTLRALRKSNLINAVDVVRDGEEALDYIFCRNNYSGRNATHLPQLVLLDIKLPKLDGIEVLKSIRSEEKYRHIPVVMLTTSTQENDMVKSYDHGANSFIQKPVDFKEFVEAVANLGVYWLALNKIPKH